MTGTSTCHPPQYRMKGGFASAFKLTATDRQYLPFTIGLQSQPWSPSYDFYTKRNCRPRMPGAQFLDGLGHLD